MGPYMASHPGLKFVFFGGKGGVGKTTMAGALALWSARNGHRTLLVSTNPVHSLSSLLDQDVFGRHTPVNGVPNLFAYEIDTRDTIERSKREIREKIHWFLKYADISTRADEFVESAMFENMIDLMFQDEYEMYVFDTAPAANARRLLGMSKVYSLWVNKLIKSRTDAQGLQQLLSFTKKKEQDPLMDYLVELQKRMSHARDLLTDDQQTSFFFVALPEALPIAVITRFIGWFREFGIPVGGVLVNMHIDQREVGSETAEFVRNRLAAQDAHMATIWQKFDGQVRAIVPLFDAEVRGTEMLSRLAEAMFDAASEGSDGR